LRKILKTFYTARRLCSNRAYNAPMTKTEAITLLGGTPVSAAKALGYSSVQAVYMWPDPLPLSTADRVRGAAQRLNINKVRKVRAKHQEQK
jgi:hypothetical protein